MANDYRIIATSPLFDADWYRAANPDVADKKTDPAFHYLRHGAQRGLMPGPHFDAAGYLRANPDVASSQINPLLHYIRHGRNENRPSNVITDECRNPTASRHADQISIPVWQETGHPKGTDKLGPESARSIDIDHSLAVPFSYLIKPRAAPGRVAAVIHLYYDEFAVELRSYLRNIPGEVDLFIATADADRKLTIERAFANWAFGTVEVRVMPNRGRDIAPKLVGFRDVYDRYDFVLHFAR